MVRKVATQGTIQQIVTLNQLWRFMLCQPGPRILFSGLLVLPAVKAYAWGWTLSDVLVIGLFFALRGGVEWAVHYYIMHAAPLPILGIRVRTPIYRMHIKHHQYADDIDGVLFKGRSVVVILSVVLLVGGALVGFRLSLLAMICTALCLFMYELFHVLSHSSIKFGTRRLASIVNAHRYHHQSRRLVYLGVSSLIADRFLKTDNPE